MSPELPRNVALPAGVRAVALLAFLGACNHTEPFQPSPREPLGPYERADVRRLTFNTSEDSDPFVIGDSVIVFTRIEPNRSDGDRCLAYLPVEGGTLLQTLCPHGMVADTMRDAWLFPAVSPGGRLAYVSQESRITSFAPGVRRLTVGTTRAPDSVTFALNLPVRLFGQEPNSVRRLAWDGATRLRFVAGDEGFPLVNNVRDTTFSALGLAVVEVESGVVSEEPGGEGIYVYAPRADSGVWAVDAEDPAQLFALGAGIRTVAGRFSGAILDIADVGGIPVGALALGATLEWLDPGSGRLMGRLVAPGTVLRLSAAGGRRVVADVEGPLGRDLWLITRP